MKKVLIAMAMACTLGFLGSCSSSSNDDNGGGNTPVTPSVWETFKGGNYSVWCDDLNVTDSTVDYELLDFNMSVTKAGDNTAKVSIKSTNDSIAIDVAEATIVSNDGYTIKGTGSVAIKGKVVTNEAAVDAKISADNSTVSVNLSISGASSTLVNSDKPAMAKLMTCWTVQPAGSFKLNWTTKEGTSIVYGGESLPVATVTPLVEKMANQKLGNVLSTVAFTRHGKIIAQYRPANSKDGKWKIAEGYATYTVVGDDLITIVLDTDKILSSVTDTADKTALSAILGIFKETGIPVHIKWGDNNNSAFFYVDKTFAKGLAQDETLKALVNNLKDDDLNGMGVLVKNICGQVPGLLENTTEFEAGLNLSK